MVRSESVARVLARQDAVRVPGLVPVRHERMSAGAFAFFRGSALLQAQDLASAPHSGLTVQLCGDAHLANFGLFASRDQRPIFDVNDFDETHPGPFEWDVKRLAVSLVLAARDIGVPSHHWPGLVAQVVRSYRTSMEVFSSMREFDLWRYRVDDRRLHEWAAGSSGGMRRAIRDGLNRAQRRDSWSALAKLTEVREGQLRFKDVPPLLTPMPAGHRAVVDEFFARYLASLSPDQALLLSRYEVRDVAFKVVGVGSVGLFAVAVLLQGRDAQDVLAMQLKQAVESVLEPFTAPSVFANHGQRVVVGQTLMQAAGDPLLGFVEGSGGRQHYVRQLRDMKWSPDLAALSETTLGQYAGGCAHTLARAHARSGDALALSAYMGSGSVFDDAVAQYALGYVPRVDEYFAEFLEYARQCASHPVPDVASWWDAELTSLP